MTLTWTCDRCCEPIEDDDGWLTVALLDAIAREREWEAFHAAQGGWEAVDLGELMRLPGKAPWKVLHRDCDPDLDGQSYWFDVSRIRTSAELANWWMHLSAKRWFRHTAWDDLIRSRVIPQLEDEVAA